MELDSIENKSIDYFSLKIRRDPYQTQPEQRHMRWR